LNELKYRYELYFIVIFLKKEFYIFIKYFCIEMKRKSNYRIVSIVLALLLFVSSTGFSMDVHFCKGEIESVSFFGKATPCEMMKEKEPVQELHACCKALQEQNQYLLSFQQKSCCHNESLIVLTNTDIELSNSLAHNINSVQFVLITSTTSLFIFLAENDVEDNFNYPPPKHTKDLNIFYQVFRI
jgi:hypothetical protein